MSTEPKTTTDPVEIAPDPIEDTEVTPAAPEPSPAPEPAAEPEKVEQHMTDADRERLAISARFKKVRDEDVGADYSGDHRDPEMTYGDVVNPEPVAEPVAQAAPERRFKVKVNGVEKEISEAELIASAQKGLAGDDYIDQAKAILRDAKQARQPSHQNQDGTEPAQRQADDLDAVPEPSPNPEDDPLVKVIETIQYGDPKDAAKALRETMRTGQAEESQRALLTQRINDDIVRDLDAAKKFAEDNPDIATDENASAVVKKNLLDGYREDLRKLGIPEDRIPTNQDSLAQHHRFYKLNGQAVRSVPKLLEDAKTKFVTWKTGSPNPAPNSRPQGAKVAVNVDRTERRTAIPQQPTRATVPAQMTTPKGAQPAPAGDRSAAVNKMRQARGQFVT